MSYAFRLSSKGGNAEIERVPRERLESAEVGERFLTEDGIVVALGGDVFKPVAPSYETAFLIAFAKRVRALERKELDSDEGKIVADCYAALYEGDVGERDAAMLRCREWLMERNYFGQTG